MTDASPTDTPPVAHTPYVTAIVRFRLRPGITLPEALDEVRHTVPIYRAEPALVRKQIHLDVGRGEGRSIYLWRDRAAAEAFFERARPMIAAQTGAEPEVELLPTHVLVDNSTGEVAFP